MKILVCDDESIERDLHVNLLVENGICADDIIEAVDGNDVLQKMKENEIKLFLLDWNMPGPSGVELVKIIRGTAKYKDTPIIMITAEGGRYFIIDGLEAGVTNYILKPIVAELFWEKIKPYAQEFLPTEKSSISFPKEL